MWSLYWQTRHSSPHDAMGGEMTLDLVRALDLSERLYGSGDTRRLAEKLQAMDAAYLSDRVAKAKRAKEKKGR